MIDFLIRNIWWVMLAVVLGCCGLGWWILSTSSMYRLLDMVNPARPKYIKAKMFCEDKQIRDRKLKIETYCVTDEKLMSSFHLVHDLLITGYHTGKQFLCLNPRSSFPIDFHGKLTPELKKKYPTAQRIYIDTANDIDNKSTTEAAKSFMGMSLSLIAMGGALIFIVMAIIVFWQRKGG